MRKRRLVAFWALPLVATACTSEIPENGPREQLSSVTQGIVNGVPSTSADDHVVKISIGADGTCTGTLLTPNLVLTARHCVSEMDESTECGTFLSNLAASSLAISIGATSNTVVARGARIFTDEGTSGCGNDIALFQLDRDLSTAKTATIRLSPLTIGEAARTVGFGESGNGQLTPGRYAKAGIKVDAVGPSSYTFKTKTNQSIPVSVPTGEILTGESTCYGDSGGPLFDAAGSVIGITSRGTDETCVDRPSIYSDTASHASFVRAAAKTAGYPLKEATASPGSADPSSSEPATDADDDTIERAPGDGDGDADDGHAPRVASANRGCSATTAGSSRSPLLGLLVLAALVVPVRLRRRAQATRRRGGPV